MLNDFGVDFQRLSSVQKSIAAILFLDFVCEKQENEGGSLGT